MGLCITMRPSDYVEIEGIGRVYISKINGKQVSVRFEIEDKRNLKYFRNYFSSPEQKKDYEARQAEKAYLRDKRKASKVK